MPSSLEFSSPQSPLPEQKPVQHAIDTRPERISEAIEALHPTFDAAVVEFQKRLQPSESGSLRYNENPIVSFDHPELSPIVSELQSEVTAEMSQVMLLSLLAAKVRPEFSQFDAEVVGRAVPEITEPGLQLEAATRCCALIHVVERLRTGGRHKPSWEQTATALYMLAHPQQGELQRIEMYTGEGKTFTIGMTAIWRVLRGEAVTIHTDKYSNVQQSYDKMKPLYDIFGVDCQMLRDREEVSEREYSRYVHRLDEYDVLQKARKAGGEHVPELKPRPKVEYGVWAQYIHEDQLRAMTIVELKHQRRCQTEATRQIFGSIERIPQKSLEAVDEQIAWLEAQQHVDAAVLDEGDVYLDLGTDKATEDEMDPLPYSESEQQRLALAWGVLGGDQPPEMFRRIAEATGLELDEVTEAYSITRQMKTEGTYGDDETYVQTGQRTLVDIERLYASSLARVSTDPEAIRLLLRTVKKTTELSKKEVKKIKAAFGESTSTQNDELVLNWETLAEKLPPPTRRDIQQFFAPDHPILSNDVFADEPVVQRVVKRSETKMDGEELAQLRELVPDFDRLLALSRMIMIIDQIWLGEFQHFGQSIFQTLELQRGNDYQIVQLRKVWPNGKVDVSHEVEVLSRSGEPEPGKEFSELIQAFLLLKHGYPLSHGQLTVASISPLLWYQQRARRGVKTTSISGSQRKPDYEATPTGKGKVTELPTRVEKDQATKLEHIAAYVAAHRDQPVLLCVRDVRELRVLQQALAKTYEAEDLIVLDAAHAHLANEYVSQIEAGKVVILQISARGQDFGRPIEEGGRKSNSFENGLIVLANAMDDEHQLRQALGRLGGQRPSGRFVLFTSPEDAVMQQRYTYRESLPEQHKQQFAELERQYQSIVQATAAQQELGWPETFSDAYATFLQALESPEENRPLWVQVLSGSGTLPEAYGNLARNLRGACQRLLRAYDKLSDGYLEAVKYQQELNIIAVEEHHRTEMIIDRGLQSIWKMLMSTSGDTPFGELCTTLMLEQKKRLIAQMFEDGDVIYHLATRGLHDPSLLARHAVDERKFARFCTVLIETIKRWAALEALPKQFAVIWEKYPQAKLPPNIERLADWVASYEEDQQVRAARVPGARRGLTGKRSGGRPKKPRSVRSLVPPAVFDQLRVIADEYELHINKEMAVL